MYFIGAFDFAGGSVVHMAGGASCLAAALVLGPRHGRFSHDDNETYGMACPTNVILGTFFLWWGWIGFNCGSTLAITGGTYTFIFTKDKLETVEKVRNS